jgi:tellurite resistance protein
LNPSTTGWIEKFGQMVTENRAYISSNEALYALLKEQGFVYGMNVRAPENIKPSHRLTPDENAKINLLFGFFYTHELLKQEQDFGDFVDSVFQFYQELEIGRITYLQKILGGNKTSAQLEKLIDSRIYLDANIISKTFNSIITNTLLLVDVLTYRAYLSGTADLKKYAEELEFIVMNIAFQALKSKKKNKKDDRLRELIASSLTYSERAKAEIDLSYVKTLPQYQNTLEARYFVDVACLTVWEDHSLEARESQYVYRIGSTLGLPKEEIALALQEVSLFFQNHAEELPILKEDNLTSQFYDSMSKLVDKLILRNSKRLQKEFDQSKELVFLLSKSTVRDLSKEEKKKVQEQLLDIFKSIPSLAIFLLPGGAVLLPIFIKLVPKLLPSSFDENRVENAKKE